MQPFGEVPIAAPKHSASQSAAPSAIGARPIAFSEKPNDPPKPSRVVCFSGCKPTSASAKIKKSSWSPMTPAPPKTGRRFFGLGFYRDPSDKNPGASKRKVAGHSWVTLGQLVQRGTNGFCFPLSARVFVPQTECDDTLPFSTKITLLTELLKNLPLRKRRVICIVDNLYAKKEIGDCLQETMSDGVLISRLRGNAALYKLPENPEKKRRGRPRLRGAKVSLKALLEHREKRRVLEVVSSGKKRRLEAFVDVLTPSPTLGAQPILAVVFPLVSGKRMALFSTDVSMPAARVVSLYGSRWKIEGVFRALKMFGGLGGRRQRGFSSLKRHGTLCLVS